MNTDESQRACMTDEEMNKRALDGFEQCVVEALSDGEICWDINEDREREPIHQVKKGERFWCWNFQKKEDGKYTHDYSNMAPTNVLINTDVSLKLVYLTNNCEDPVLFQTELDKAPNIL